MLTPQDFLANLASIVNCYHHHQGAAASQEVDDKWKSKDIETPDDDHSNEHQSQVSSGLLSAFLDSFKDPMVGQAPNVTIADFYKMVEALTDEDEKDAPDSFEEFSSFLNTLTSDIELLSKSQQAMNIQEFSA